MSTTEQQQANNAYDHAEKGEKTDMEGPNSHRIEKIHTRGGHIDDRAQPSLPVVHRSFANPAPLGLLSFATGMFLISILGVHARGLMANNVMMGVLMFFGGVCQFIAGIMEFIAGNTFGATVFPSYGAFNLSFAMISIPGTGIVAAYSDAQGNILPSFYDALGIYCWAWFILTVIYTVAAIRSSWPLFLTLFFLDIVLVLLAAGYMAKNESVLTAGYSVGFVVTFGSYWAGCAGLFSGGLTPFSVPSFPMYKED